MKNLDNILPLPNASVREITPGSKVKSFKTASVQVIGNPEQYKAFKLSLPNKFYNRYDAQWQRAVNAFNNPKFTIDGQFRSGLVITKRSLISRLYTTIKNLFN